MLKLIWSRKNLTQQPHAERIRPPKPRVVPEASFVEISKRSKALGRELSAHLYLYDNKAFIVSPVAGIIEAGEPTVLPLDVNDQDLGCCVCDNLLKFNPTSPDNMQLQKRSDWAVYKVSGAKSIRRFEEKSWTVRIRAINTAIMMQAGPINTLWPEIWAYGESNPLHEKVGRVLRRTLRAAQVLRENGIV
jgi:hypothetical protein